MWASTLVFQLFQRPFSPNDIVWDVFQRLNFTDCQNFPGSDQKKCIRSNILKVHELFWSVELHNMIFMGPSTKGSKFFRQPVNGDSTTVLHEEFKSYGWGQVSRSPAVLWLGWKWSWMLGWAFRCWKAGLLSPAVRILDSISQNLPAQLFCSWNTGAHSKWKPFLQHCTGSSGRENKIVYDRVKLIFVFRWVWCVLEMESKGLRLNHQLASKMGEV